MRTSRTRYGALLTIFGMPGDKTSASAALWAAVQTIMKERYGRENLNRFAKDSKIGLGNTSRIKQQKTSIGIGIIEKIAKAYGLEPWQLLVHAEEGAQLLKLLKAWSRPEGRDMLIGATEAVFRRHAEEREPVGGSVRPGARHRR